MGQWKLYFRGSIIIRACWKQGWSSYCITMRMWLWGKGYFESHWVIWGQIQAFLNSINYISLVFTHIDRNYKNPRLYWSQFILLRYAWHGLGSKPYRFIFISRFIHDRFKCTINHFLQITFLGSRGQLRLKTGWWLL